MTTKTTNEAGETIPHYINEEEDLQLAAFMDNDEDELYDEELINSMTYLVEKGHIHFPSKVDDETYYSPYREAFSHWHLKQQDFTVHYAFPNGRSYPVATFWAHYKDGNNNDRPKCVNIDLSKVMDKVIEYYLHNGYFAKDYVQ